MKNYKKCNNLWKEIIQNITDKIIKCMMKYFIQNVQIYFFLAAKIVFAIFFKNNYKVIKILN